MSAVLLAICVYVALLYLPGAREVKRLESTAKSPIFEQFGSALTGVGTIRAFDKTDIYIKSMWAKIDDHSTTFWHLWVFNRWMGWRMAFVGGLFSTIVAIVIILLPEIDAALAGFALSFALAYGQTVMWTIRHYTNLELNMNVSLDTFSLFRALRVEERLGKNYAKLLEWRGDGSQQRMPTVGGDG